MPPRLLVAASDLDLSRSLAADIRAHGYRAIEVLSHQAVVELLADIDLIVLDLGLGGCRAIDLCAFMRKHSDVPIIAIVGSDREQVIAEAFRAGIDDFVSLPVSPESELMPRARSALGRRRGGPQAASRALVRGALTVLPDARETWVGARRVDLTYREFDLLEYFARHEGLVVSRHQLMVEIWRMPEQYPRRSERTIDTHVSALRKKLGRGPVRISPVRGVGYCLKVRSGADDASP